MKMPRLLWTLFGGLAFTFGLGGCQEGLTENKAISCPSRTVFVAHVSELIERRCATLDCHGSDFRPMRVFGQYGLRHPQELNRSGGEPTTGRERYDNWLAVCAVEPEKTSQVAQDPGGAAVNTLLLVRKGRGQEGHKGGKVFNPFDEADQCVVGWLRGDPEVRIAEACAKAIDKLP
jgi:hypothetical protein